MFIQETEEIIEEIAQGNQESREEIQRAEGETSKNYEKDLGGFFI